MHQTTITRLLTLLTLWVSVAWAAVAEDSTMHAVRIVAANHGTIETNRQSAAEGDMVTLKVMPADGYDLIGGTLLVEKIGNTNQADAPVLSAKRVPGIGAYVSVAKATANTYTFLMPATDVEVRATFGRCFEVTIHAAETTDTTHAVSNVTVRVVVTDEQAGTVAVNGINVPGEVQPTQIVVYIPATVTDAGGKEYQVTAIASYAFYGHDNVTDVYLPDTDSPLQIGTDAFLVDNNEGDDHHIIRIHTPLHLLDDYALMTALGENYATGHIQATAIAKHQYWTFSCGVDVVLPEGVGLYICSHSSASGITLEEVKGASVIKANNGVVLAGPTDEARRYEMEVSPSADRPSGTHPATHDAKTYGGNLLEPVIEACHYDRGGYYVLANGAFHPITQEGVDVLLPACKAVLKVKSEE